MCRWFHCWPLSLHQPFLCHPCNLPIMNITLKCICCVSLMSLRLSWSSPSVSELSGLSLFLSLSYSPLPYLCFLPVCVLAAVSVWGDAAGAPGDRSVSRQPAGEAPPGGVDAAATALTSGGTSGASCRCQPQQRKTVRGHGTAWTPFPQTGAGGCPGREGVQPHPHLSRVQTLPRTEDAPHRGPRGPPISHSQWGEHRVGQDHK